MRFRAVLSIDSIFDSYFLQSASESNTINLEVPLQPLIRALRSTVPANATGSTLDQSATIRLTKKDNIPTLCVTLVLKTPVRSTLPSTGDDPNAGVTGYDSANLPVFSRDRSTSIAQDVPIRVLSPQQVAGLHEPRCREPDVHILLPSLAQLKAVSDRFIRLASSSSVSGSVPSSRRAAKPPRLTLSANMHGTLRIGLSTQHLSINSTWSNLTNPSLDPANVPGGEDGVANHPSTRMRELPPDDENAWATVHVDAKDWGRVLSVGRVGDGVRVVACFCDGFALVLYVYLPSGMDDSGGDDCVLTYYVTSYST
ncbi:MAG: hypothetical protein Q9162_004491 [Coniocarpon cinnabarinum]